MSIENHGMPELKREIDQEDCDVLHSAKRRKITNSELSVSDSVRRGYLPILEEIELQELNLVPSSHFKNTEEIHFKSTEENPKLNFDYSKKLESCFNFCRKEINACLKVSEMLVSKIRNETPRKNVLGNLEAWIQNISSCLTLEDTAENFQECETFHGSDTTMLGCHTLQEDSQINVIRDVKNECTLDLGNSVNTEDSEDNDSEIVFLKCVNNKKIKDIITERSSPIPIVKECHTTDANEVTVSQQYQNPQIKALHALENINLSSIEIPAGVDLLINSLATNVIPEAYSQKYSDNVESISAEGLQVKQEQITSHNEIENHTCNEITRLETSNAQNYIIEQSKPKACVGYDSPAKSKYISSETSDTNITRVPISGQQDINFMSKIPENFVVTIAQNRHDFAQVPPVDSVQRAVGLKGHSKISVEEYKKRKTSTLNNKNPPLKKLQNIESANEITVSQHYQIAPVAESPSNIVNSVDISSNKIPPGINLRINSVFPVFTPTASTSFNKNERTSKQSINYEKEQSVVSNPTSMLLNHQNVAMQNISPSFVTRPTNDPQPCTSKRQDVSLIPVSLKEKVGHTFILCSELYLIVIEWSVKWFSQYETFDPSYIPPIVPLEPFAKLPQVPYIYNDDEHFYNVYLKMVLIECWYKMYVAFKEFRDIYDHSGYIQDYGHKDEFNEYVIEIFAHGSRSETVPEKNDVVLITFHSLKSEYVAMLGYVAEAKRRNFSLKHDNSKPAFQLLKSSGSGVKKFKLSIRTVFKTDSIDDKKAVKVKRLINLTAFLEQNDALYDLNKSPLYQTVLNPITSPYKLSIVLHAGNMESVTNALCRRILDPNPLLASIDTSLSHWQYIQAISSLITKLKRKKPGCKVVFISKNNSILFETAQRLLNHNVIYISREKIPELESFTLKSLMEVKWPTEARKPNVRDEYHKTEILRKATVLLAKLFAFRESWENVVELILGLLEECDISCCILDGAHDCSEAESCIPLVDGNHKYLLLGNKELSNGLSPLCNSLGYNQSMLHRAFL